MRGPRNCSVHVSRLVLAAVLVSTSAVAPTGLLAGAPNPDLTLPARLADEVDPSSPPPEARGFLEAFQGRCKLFWDGRCGTPRYVSFLDGGLELPPLSTGAEVGAAELEAAARAFVSAQHELFGISGDDLLGPTAVPLDGGYSLAFSQAEAGMPVRGSHLGMTFHAGGRLASLKAFLRRGPRPDPVDLPGDEEILFRVEEGEGARALGLERQWVFPTLDPHSLAPAVCVLADFAGEVYEVFLDHRGERFAEVPLSMGIVCDQFDWGFTALGSVNGFCPAPGDIYATAAGAASQRFHPVPAGLVRTHQGKEDLTWDDGSFEIFVSDPIQIVWPELVHGECDGTSIRPIFSIHRSINSCDPLTPAIQYEENPQDVRSNHFNFLLNQAQEPQQSFELMAFHRVQRFHEHFGEVIARNHLSFTRVFYPLKVIVPRVDQQALRGEAPRYVPVAGDSRICLSMRQSLVKWHPQTIIDHEFAHHVITSVSGSHQYDPVVDGLADALTMLRNDNPRMAFLAPLDPGKLGYSAEQSFEQLEEMRQRDSERARIDIERWTMARIFWDLHRLLAEAGKSGRAEDLLYRFLARNRVHHLTARPFELSMVLVEELLDADDLRGEHAFPGADGRRDNGTPHRAEIVAALAGVPRLAPPFLRGDVNSSGSLDLSDAVSILAFLFQGTAGWPDCLSAADANRSRWVDIADAIFLLDFLFLGGAPPPGPFPDCGRSEEEVLWCKVSSCR